MPVQLWSLHWVYLAFVLGIVIVMVMRRDTTLICVAGIVMLTLIATGSLPQAVSVVFNSFVYAISELLGTILIISVIIAMSKALSASGISDAMIAPAASLIKTPSMAYWVIGIVMMLISWFFWPSPAVALVGAVLLPVALKVGLPAMGVAIAMNLFGHGIALSGDFIIQGAPKLTADAAGLAVREVVAASVPLVFICGIVTTLVAFWLLRRDLQRGSLRVESSEIRKVTDPTDSLSSSATALSPHLRRRLALAILILFAIDVVVMVVARLQGGEATALVGGTAVIILLLVSMLTHKHRGLEKITEYLIEGFQFGFRVFGPVIPIAAFFYLGDAGYFEIIGTGLPAGSQGLVNDLGIALAHVAPLNGGIGAVTLTTVGAITGLDGSGFSGISLAGSVAKLFGTAIGHGTATLTALGQIAAIWVGGGALVPWALLPAAAICGVDPFDMARRNLIPVVAGLVVTTIVAALII
ncbi:MAG: hypothetical protein GX855_02420 [Firmicutes bacterium]|nr:hypothetical protein [Bacillota bacterium]